MSGIKLSPLFIFLLMLIVLVVATTVKRWGLVSEGFISYLKNSDSFSLQTVKAYDNTANIYKLYDDIFYDHRNGNVVVLASTKYTDTADTTGSSVSEVAIVPRNNDTPSSYTRGTGVSIMSQQCAESKKRTIDSIETQWSINTVQNQLMYITWGNDTYMCVLDLTNATVAGNTVAGNTVTSYQPAITAYFNGNVKQSTNTYSDADKIPLISKFTYNDDGKDGTNVIIDFYDKVATVYQIANGIYYDYKNGNLMTKTAGISATLDVYTRGSKTVDYTYNNVPRENSTPASQLTFSQSSIAPYFINLFNGKYTIMYWANGDTTLIVILVNFLQTNGSVGCIARRFTRDGLYNSGIGDNNEDVKDDEEKEVDTDANKDLLDSFARWYIYFNTNAVGSSDYNDYLLKTQIVPPVCPACPGCKSEGVCTDCGGKGGSGTKTTDSASLAFDNKTIVGATGSAVTNTVNAAGTAVNKTIDVAGNVAGKTLDTAGNVVGKTLDTATNVVGKTFDAAGNVLGSAASTLGLDRIGYNQSYRGPANTSGNGNASGYPSSGFKNTEYRPGSNTTGVPNYPNSNPNDPYSYNGALQSKGGNFIAVTADFSRFGR